MRHFGLSPLNELRSAQGFLRSVRYEIAAQDGCYFQQRWVERLPVALEQLARAQAAAIGWASK